MGRNRLIRTRKPLSSLRGTEGSYPSLSASPLEDHALSRPASCRKAAPVARGGLPVKCEADELAGRSVRARRDLILPRHIGWSRAARRIRARRGLTLPWHIGRARAARIIGALRSLPRPGDPLRRAPLAVGVGICLGGRHTAGAALGRLLSVQLIGHAVAGASAARSAVPCGPAVGCPHPMRPRPRRSHGRRGGGSRCRGCGAR